MSAAAYLRPDSIAEFRTWQKKERAELKKKLTPEFVQKWLDKKQKTQKDANADEVPAKPQPKVIIGHGYVRWVRNRVAAGRPKVQQILGGGAALDDCLRTTAAELAPVVVVAGLWAAFYLDRLLARRRALDERQTAQVRKGNPVRHRDPRGRPQISLPRSGKCLVRGPDRYRRPALCEPKPENDDGSHSAVPGPRTTGPAPAGVEPVHPGRDVTRACRTRTQARCRAEPALPPGQPTRSVRRRRDLAERWKGITPELWTSLNVLAEHGAQAVGAERARRWPPPVPVRPGHPLGR
ncbi:hypothetical protein ACRAWF_25835 [Streptomyces sp. L7]